MGSSFLCLTIGELVLEDSSTCTVDVGRGSRGREVLRDSELPSPVAVTCIGNHQGCIKGIELQSPSKPSVIKQLQGNLSSEWPTD